MHWTTQVLPHGREKEGREEPQEKRGDPDRHFIFYHSWHRRVEPEAGLRAPLPGDLRGAASSLSRPIAPPPSLPPCQPAVPRGVQRQEPAPPPPPRLGRGRCGRRPACPGHRRPAGRAGGRWGHCPGAPAGSLTRPAAAALFLRSVSPLRSSAGSSRSFCRSCTGGGSWAPPPEVQLRASSAPSHGDGIFTEPTAMPHPCRAAARRHARPPALPARLPLASPQPRSHPQAGTRAGGRQAHGQEAGRRQAGTRAGTRTHRAPLTHLPLAAPSAASALRGPAAAGSPGRRRKPRRPSTPPAPRLRQ